MSADPAIAFHVTRAAALRSIMASGLEPRIPADMPGEPRAVYLFPDLDALHDACMSWLSDRFEDDEALVVIEVDVSGLLLVRGAGFELISDGPIPPSRLRVRADVDL